MSESSPENTLMTDGTIKYGYHYSTYAIFTNDGTNYTMDLHHNFSVFCTDYVRHNERNFGRLRHGTKSFRRTM